MTRLENDLISRKALLEEVKLIGNQPLPDVRTLKDLEQAIVNTYHAILNQITNAPTIEDDSGEAVGELVFDPMFYPARKVPLVNWKIDLMDYDVSTKFYTSPPKRKWVDLDPFEVDALIFSPPKDDIELAQLVRKIQAKLKELNHGYD